MSETYGFGDPDGMRALATQLKARATQVEALGARISAPLRSLTFRGPAASRFREHISADLSRINDLADQLNDLANHVTTSAAEVEKKIAAERQRRAAAAERQRQRELEAERAARGR